MARLVVLVGWVPALAGCVGAPVGYPGYGGAYPPYGTPYAMGVPPEPVPEGPYGVIEPVRPVVRPAVRPRPRPASTYAAKLPDGQAAPAAAPVVPECRTVTELALVDGQEVRQEQRYCRTAPSRVWVKG